jgi:restriction endonuclease S subunit
VREKWKYIQLGDKDYFERFGGGTPNKGGKDYWDEGTIPWLSNTELKDNELNIICTTKNQITEKGLRNSSAAIIPRNCVLLTCTASIGKVGINEIELATNQQFNSFKCSDEVFPKYLAYFLLTQKTNLIKLGGSTSFCHVNTTNLGKLNVPLPSHETQRRIVAILDKAEETRRLRAQAYELARRLI